MAQQQTTAAPITPPAQAGLWLGIHTHRFGVSVYPLWSVGPPDEEELIRKVIQTDWEPDREETIEVVGPFAASEIIDLAKLPEPTGDLAEEIEKLPEQDRQQR